jgi:rRNA-processing protein FCF1
VTRPTRDPLDGIDRLLVDANNVLHALGRRPTAPPAAALIGRLRAVIPAQVAIELVFDGPPEPGSRGRIASGLRVRYAGSKSADALLIALLEAAGPPMPGYEPTVLVVTDDRELRAALRARGASIAGTDWLLRRLDRARLGSPSVGRPRPPHGARTGGSHDEVEATGPGWRPGRGATVKKGNARRSPKRRAEPGGPR